MTDPTNTVRTERPAEPGRFRRLTARIPGGRARRLELSAEVARLSEQTAGIENVLVELVALGRQQASLAAALVDAEADRTGPFGRAARGSSTARTRRRHLALVRLGQASDEQGADRVGLHDPREGI